jgi:tetratricopeptide (TPR) repeat protein
MVLALFSLERVENLPGLRWGAPLVVVLLGLLTGARNEVWRDEYSLWSDASAKNPNAVRAYVYMGNYARGRGDAQRALSEYERALRLEGDNVVARAGMANSYQDMGRVDEAIVQFAELLRRSPQMTDLHYSLGRAFQQAGSLPEARAQYATLPLTSPHYAIALNNIGTIYELEGKLDSALITYRDAAQLGAEDGHRNSSRLAELLVARAESAFQSGDYLATENWSRQILVGGPEHAYARFFLATGLFAQGRLGESIHENEILVRAHPHLDEGWLQLANAYETTGKTSDAQRVYERLKRDSKNSKMRELAEQRLRILRERAE